MLVVLLVLIAIVIAIIVMSNDEDDQVERGAQANSLQNPNALQPGPRAKDIQKLLKNRLFGVSNDVTDPSEWEDGCGTVSLPRFRCVSTKPTDTCR